MSSEDITYRNEDVLAGPGVLIMWDVELTIAAFNAAIAGGAVPPPWLNVPVGGNHTFSCRGLKSSILQALSGGGARIGNSVIAPNTIQQYANVKTQLGFIGIDPFFRSHAVCPIGRNYILVDRGAGTTGVADPVKEG